MSNRTTSSSCFSYPFLFFLSLSCHIVSATFCFQQVFFFLPRCFYIASAFILPSSSFLPLSFFFSFYFSHYAVFTVAFSSCLSPQCHDNITNATPISPAPLTPDTDRRRHSHGYSLLKGHVYPCFKSKAEQMNQTRIRLKQDLSRLHNFYQDFGHRLLLMFVPSLLFILGFVGVFFSAIHIQVD